MAKRRLLLLARTFLLALVLTVPLALAGSQTWSDPSGDTGPRVFDVTVPTSLACTDARMDLTSVSIAADDSTITVTLTHAGTDGPRCQAAGVDLPLEGTPHFDMQLGDIHTSGNYVWLTDWYPTGCFLEFSYGDILEQPPCTMQRDGASEVFTFATSVMAENGNGDFLPLDLRTIDWPDGPALTWERASPGASSPLAPVTIEFDDAVDVQGVHF